LKLNVINLSDFIINHHEEHEERKTFFIFVFFVVKNITVSASDYF